jgi:hypothetical protein
MGDLTDGYAIFANGTLQYVSTADTRDEAYGEYAEDVGFDRGVYPMTSDGVSFHYIPPTDMEKWEDADVHDHPVVNHPV